MRAPCPLVRRGAKVPGGIRKTPPTTHVFGFTVSEYFIPGRSAENVRAWDPGEKSRRRDGHSCMVRVVCVSVEASEGAGLEASDASLEGGGGGGAALELDRRAGGRQGCL